MATDVSKPPEYASTTLSFIVLTPLLIVQSGLPLLDAQHEGGLLLEFPRLCRLTDFPPATLRLARRSSCRGIGLVLDQRLDRLHERCLPLTPTAAFVGDALRHL